MLSVVIDFRLYDFLLVITNKFESFIITQCFQGFVFLRLPNIMKQRKEKKAKLKSYRLESLDWCLSIGFEEMESG